MPHALPSFDPDFADPAGWAAMYRECGLQVVPGRLPNVLNWKSPGLATWAEFQEELVSDAVFERWFSTPPHGQMGLITGRASGGVFVVDLDTHKGPQADAWWQAASTAPDDSPRPGTTTAEQRTGGGGRQLFFRAPAYWTPPTGKASPQGVDIRGQGGFAIMPPTLHSSGQEYAWLPNLGPWQIGITDAGNWLLNAIDRLILEHGGGWKSSSPGERTQSTGTFDAFGKQTDGREDYMTRVVWGTVLDLYRDAPINPGVDSKISLDAMQAAYERYARRVKTRIDGEDNDAGLEREGRGLSLFHDKWRRAFRLWDTKVAEEAAKPRPFEEPDPAEERVKESVRPKDPSAIRTFDFATLFLEDVPEEPDLIEPGLLGVGSFLLIGGPPKAQKSYLLQDMLVSGATGQSFLSGTFTIVRPLRVFYLQAEMNEKLLRRRAKQMTGLEPEHIDMLASNLIVSDRFRMILDPAGVEAAVKLIKGQFPDELPDVLAFDPMANLYDQENENDNAQVMKFLTLRIEAVRQLINPSAAVILVHHATKKGPDEIRKDPFNCFRGGGALRGHYDAGIIIFRKDPEGDEREVHFEFRGAETPDPLTVRLEHGRMVKRTNVFGFEPRKGWPDEATQRVILDNIKAAWDRGQPWSNAPNTERLGRFAPTIIKRDYPSLSKGVIQEMINSWLMPEGVLVIAERSAKTGLRGLCLRRYAP